MVRNARLRAWVTPLAAALALSSCELFTTTPFPGFVDKTDISIDLGSRIDAIAGGKGIASYDLEVVTSLNTALWGTSEPPRVLLLAEPPSTDPSSGGFDYEGKIIFMDKDLNVVGTAGTKDTLTYFSKPYAYAHDGNILAGYTILTPDGAPAPSPAPNLNPTGLEGFAFVDSGTTYIFATPSGQYASFDLSFAAYNLANWGVVTFPSNPAQTCPIVPAASPDRSDSTLGYQLVGLTYDPATANITFILSQPGTGKIMAARTTLATATGGSVALLPSGSWPVSMDVDRPDVHADPLGLALPATFGFFLVRRDGWMERYTWTGPGTPPALTGDPVRIVGDRSLTRRYAFLVDPSGGPSYMYRFDPSSRILTRYRRWW